MNYSITLNEIHYKELKAHLLREDEKERIAYVIFGRSLITADPWTTKPEERFLSKQVICLNDSQLEVSTKTRVSWSTKSFLDALSIAEENGDAIGLVHNHPYGAKSFSEIDDDNEYHMAKLAFNRNGGDRPHLSLILMPDGDIISRTWNYDKTTTDINYIRIVGDKVKLMIKDEIHIDKEIYDRQKLAFGKAFTDEICKLKIGIVGCGATGSAVLMLLSRLGIQNLLLIDKDKVEKSNLNRLHGVKLSDVGKYKVNVLKEELDNQGLVKNVITIKDWVNKKQNFDSIKSCDIIFGCTDDHAGRILLNRFAYHYLVPVIDIGLVITVSKTNPPKIRDLIGRVTYIFPNNTCMLCRNIIDGDIARSEDIRRNNPELYESLEEEAYVIGEGNPNPAVVTFTTETATIAVNEMIDRIQGFRNILPIQHKLRMFNSDQDLNLGNNTREGCRICGKSEIWGIGDARDMPGLN